MSHTCTVCGGLVAKICKGVMDKIRAEARAAALEEAARMLDAERALLKVDAHAISPGDPVHGAIGMLKRLAGAIRALALKDGTP